MRHAEMTFGEMLRWLRRSDPRNLNLYDTAQVIGVSTSLMSSMERGEKSPPPPEKLRELLKFLGREELFDDLTFKAAQQRGGVNIAFKGRSDTQARLAYALQRRIEDGSLPDKVAKQALELLKGDERR